MYGGLTNLEIFKSSRNLSKVVKCESIGSYCMALVVCSHCDREAHWLWQCGGLRKATTDLCPAILGL